MEERVLFALRAYGDFIIAVNAASRSRLNAPVAIIASKHLENVYKAIPVKLPDNVRIEFHDFKISNNILGCLTNRFLLGLDAVRELQALRKYIRSFCNDGRILYMESNKRLSLVSLFTGHKFRHVVSDQNVYQAYADFFSFPVSEFLSPFGKLNNGLRTLIIPDARQEHRNMSEEVIGRVSDACVKAGKELSVAFFRNGRVQLPGHTIVYSSFEELVSLVMDADMIIGTDSMPVHLAQMLGKPHYILYPAVTKDQFFTPFSLSSHTYVTFENIESLTFSSNAA
jgi:hypothetical protein